MSFFNSRKTESEEKIYSSKSKFAPEGMQRITINLMRDTYEKIQLKKIDLNKTGSDIIEECLILSMDFLEPRDRMTAEKHADLMQGGAMTMYPAENIANQVAKKKPALKKDSAASHFKIEKSIPAPSKPVLSEKALMVAKIKNTLRSMKPGDSVVLPDKSVAIRFQKMAHYRKISISKRQQKDNTYRCWRTD